MACRLTDGLRIAFHELGDKRSIEENYPAIKKWVSHIREYYMTEDFIITKDKYGDWCVPPESLEMIHSQDPARKTDGALMLPPIT